MSVEGVHDDPLAALFEAEVHKYLKSPAVADKVIERVATETRIPAILVRLAYFWLLVPAVRKLEEGIQDKAIEGLVHKVTDTFDGFFGNRLRKVLLPKLAEHMAQENANKEANEQLLKCFPAIPNVSLLSGDELTQAILTWMSEVDDAFRQDVESQLLALRDAVEKQPALDLTLAPPPEEDDPFRFVFIARKTRFVGRGSQLDGFVEFAGGDQPFWWWSVGGEAGIGKSRLALEAMLKLDSTWRAGFLPRDEDQCFRWHEWRPLYPTFITVDNAGLRIAAVEAMIQAINMAAKAGRLDWPVRVLLLDRVPDVTQLPGWDQASIAAHVMPTRFKEPVLLEGLGEEDALAVASDLAGPQNARAAVELLRRVDGENRPLFVSLAAEAVRIGTGEDLGSVLDLTRAFWRRTVKAFWAPLGAGDAELDALCLATLTGGLAIRTLSDPAWAGLGVPQASRGLREKLLSMHTLDRFPRQKEPRIQALQPSFAGEVFVLDRLQDGYELGLNPSEGLLRAAWRDSPHEVAGFVQRAFSDLPDHPAVEWFLDEGPEPGDIRANEVWSYCLRAFVASRLTVGDQKLALNALEKLLRLAKEIPRDSILTDAAYAGYAVITHFGQDRYQLAMLTFGDLVLTFLEMRREPASAAAMPPVTQRRLLDLARDMKVRPILNKLSSGRIGWPGALGGAFEAAFSLRKGIASRKDRIEFLHLLEELAQPFVSAAEGDRKNPSAHLLRLVLYLIEITRTSEEGQLGFSGSKAYKHTLASIKAVTSGDTQTSLMQAKRAYDLLSSEEMTDEAYGLIGQSLNRIVVHLHETGHFAEARSLMAIIFGSEEAISSRQAIANALGEGAAPEWVDKLYQVASGYGGGT